MTNSKAQHVVYRTCVGCRELADKSTLARFVTIGNEIIYDDKMCLPGRGAYLHKSDTCLELALKKNSFNRTLKSKADVTTLSKSFLW